jgi:hypothetical protein
MNMASRKILADGRSAADRGFPARDRELPEAQSGEFRNPTTGAYGCRSVFKLQHQAPPRRGHVDGNRAELNRARERRDMLAGELP